MLKKVKLSSLKPNPWRHFETYKIVKEKVDTLKESIESTGFWKGQITARPAKPSGYEIAWGHHRWMAAKSVLGDNAFIEIIIDDLTDDDMLTRMARENNEVYDANASMDIEVVKAALEGSVQGKIHLPKNLTGNRQLKAEDYVDSSKISSANFTTFSKDALVRHLGMKPWRVTTALENLKLVHENYVDVKDYEDLSPRQSQELAKETRRAKVQTGDKAATKKIAKKIAQTMSKPSAGKAKNDRDRGGYRQAKRVAASEISKARGENQDLKRFLKKVEGATSATVTAANKIRDLLDTLEAANVETFSGAPAAELERAFKRVNESMRMFAASYPTKTDLKLVK